MDVLLMLMIIDKDVLQELVLDDVSVTRWLSLLIQVACLSTLLVVSNNFQNHVIQFLFGQINSFLVFNLVFKLFIKCPDYGIISRPMKAKSETLETLNCDSEKRARSMINQKWIW